MPHIHTYTGFERAPRPVALAHDVHCLEAAGLEGERGIAGIPKVASSRNSNGRGWGKRERKNVSCQFVAKVHSLDSERERRRGLRGTLIHGLNLFSIFRGYFSQHHLRSFLPEDDDCGSISLQPWTNSIPLNILGRPSKKVT